MSASKLGVGIIGVQPGRSFSAIAHIPALRALPQYEIVALSTTRRASAEAAAREFGVARAYDNAAALVADPAVNLVVVTVKVPNHLELVTAAANAGKAVYCEWPLGNGLAEAEKMAQLAKVKGVPAAIGLQARSAPAVNYVRDLVAQGYVGEVQSTTLIGSGLNWGAVMEAPNEYTADKKNGATLLSIPFGHTIDALCYALGEVREVTALLANRRTKVTMVETGRQIPLTTEDQLVVGGRLDSGAVLAVHYRGGMNRGTGLLWEINGSEGDLQLTAFGGHAQLFDLSLRGGKGQDQALQPLEIPAKYRWAPPLEGFAFNVAQAYVHFAADIRDGTHLCPGFDEAVTRHRLLAAVESSAASGKRVTVE
ncbi:MAG TPA: Gfo/Idh/MocA family oxidoreductase [Steroidobacteraceae bacterium]|nr:Gfo/Idh/MocA family oxidoreductase [Steroidobacteraceae bacterium]